MIRLRPYKKCDEKNILKWCNDELVFHRWGGDHFGSYPLEKEAINNKYFKDNGDCKEEDNFYPFTAVDDNEMVGHFIMRYIHNDPAILRFGWVIVNSSKRGCGIGKEMLKLGLKYAFEVLKVKKVTIGVFENNPSGYYCYKGVGFKEVPMEKEEIVLINDEQWKIIEMEIQQQEYFMTKEQ